MEAKKGASKRILGPGYDGPPQVGQGIPVVHGAARSKAYYGKRYDISPDIWIALKTFNKKVKSIQPGNTIT